MKIEIESKAISHPEKKNPTILYASVCIVMFLLEGGRELQQNLKINSVLAGLIIMYTPKWKLFSWCLTVSLWRCD